MPHLTAAQVAQLRELAGLPADDTSDIGAVFAAAKQRLAGRQADPRRRDAVVLAAVNAGRIPVSRVEFWSRAYEADPAGTEQTLATLAAVTPSSAASSTALDYPDPSGVGADVAHLFAPGSRAELEQRWAWEDAQAAAGGLSDDEYHQLFPDEQ